MAMGNDREKGKYYSRSKPKKVSARMPLASEIIYIQSIIFDKVYSIILYR